MIFSCPNKCAEGKTEHTFLKEQGEYNEIYLVRCDNCKAEHTTPRKVWLFYEAGFDDPQAGKQAYLTKYPRLEACSGSWVKSKDHEREVLRRKGYTPVE